MKNIDQKFLYPGRSLGLIIWGFWRSFEGFLSSTFAKLCDFMVRIRGSGVSLCLLVGTPILCEFTGLSDRFWRVVGW